MNPAFRADDLSDSLSIFGRDMLQVFSSHVVFVDVRDRSGLGVGAEMMWAKVNSIPVVTWSPKNSHYNKEKTTLLDIEVSNFIHPFVYCLSDKIVKNLEEGSAWIDFLLSNPDTSIKGIEYIATAIQHYQKSQFHRDLPMRDLIESCEELKQRAERPQPQIVLN